MPPKLILPTTNLSIEMVGARELACTSLTVFSGLSTCEDNIWANCNFIVAPPFDIPLVNNFSTCCWNLFMYSGGERTVGISPLVILANFLPIVSTCLSQV